MCRRWGIRRTLMTAALSWLLSAWSVFADPVAVRFPEGTLHGFLTLRLPDGKVLAAGDLLQTVRRGVVTARLIFKFRDGSLSDETAVFSQRGRFKLIRHHLVQRGPAFEQPVDLTIDTASGQVAVRYANDKGEPKIESTHMDLPADLANGLLSTLLKNVRADAPTTLSLVVATPKPRLVKLKVEPQSPDSLSIGGVARKAAHYLVKVEIGGFSGLVAPLVGKQPPDSHVWILQSEVPAFVRSQSPMFAGGPLWQIDLVAPAWPSR
jgi:hypothetical protein